MSMRYDCRDPQLRTAGIDAAVTAARGGELIVLPTDTVYGIGADAFTPSAVITMLAAKGRGRNMPPPVLVGTARAAAALVDDLGAFGQDLIDEFWPGALTLVFRASPTLLWDLGDTKGTVALRMPLHSVALDVLKQTGPLAVSSANRHGLPSATSADEAERQLGEAVSVYLDGGPCTDNIPSTILDLTGAVPKVLRSGAISVDRLRAVTAVLAENEHYAENAGPSADGGAPDGGAPDGGAPDGRAPDGRAPDGRAADRSAADFKPAAPHPLQSSGGSLDPAAGEPPSGA